MEERKWVKRNPNLNSLKDIVELNSKMPLAEFLNPKKDPYLSGLSDVIDVIKAHKDMPITVVGDYDCDGVMASTIAKLALEEFTGKEVRVRVPRRFSEGFGLSMKIIDEINEGLVITVDNGIVAHEQVKRAKEKGLVVIVTDHHLPSVDEETGEILLPEADAILDPHAILGSEFSYYCGAGLAYRFAKELVPNSPLLDAMKIFASVATVADVMPLVGDNRLLVKEGLELINKRKGTTGLNVILEKAKLSYITEEDYGFFIGPIVNASGRLYDDGPMDVIEVLSSHMDPNAGFACEYSDFVADIADKVDVLIERNEERKNIVKTSMAKAYQLIEAENLLDSKPLIVYDESFSEGIVGIIAGQLAEDLRTPAIVFTNAKEEGMLKGSARTFGEVHLKELLDTASDILARYGGHAGAAGLSVKADRLDALRERLAASLKNTGIDLDQDRDVTYYDLEIGANDAKKILTELDMYAPFGEGNPRPIFKIEDFECSPINGKFAMALGKAKEHVKWKNSIIEAVGFSMYQDYLNIGEPKQMDFIGNLSWNFFNNEFKAQINVIEFKDATKQTETDLFKTLQGMLSFV